jgi:hypothetical protein
MPEESREISTNLGPQKHFDQINSNLKRFALLYVSNVNGKTIGNKRRRVECKAVHTLREDPSRRPRTMPNVLALNRVTSFSHTLLDRRQVKLSAFISNYDVEMFS